MSSRAVATLVLLFAVAVGVRALGQSAVPGVTVCIADGREDAGEVSRDISIAPRAEPPVRTDGNYDEHPNRVDGYPDECQALLRWDLTGKGAAFVPVAAAITLHITDPSWQTSYVYGVRRGWTASEATWLTAGTDGGPWAQGGALAVDVDVDSNAIAALEPSELGEVRMELDGDGLQLVDDWLARRRPNHGIIIRELNMVDAVEFSQSSEDGGRAPRLELTQEDGGVVVFVNDPDSDAFPQSDTTICKAFPPNLNFRDLVVSGPEVGESAALLHFDTRGIPAEAIVTSARLELSGEGDEILARELLRDFDEESATWGLAMEGQPWSAAGATGESDVRAAVLGEYAPIDETGSMELTDAGVATVQGWVKDSATNHGLALVPKHESGISVFHDRHASVVAKRPALCVTYLRDDKIELNACGCGSSGGSALAGLVLLAALTRLNRRARR